MCLSDFTWKKFDVLRWESRGHLCVDTHIIASEGVQFVRQLYQGQRRLIVRIKEVFH